MEAVDRFRAPKLTAAILEWKVRGDIGDDFDKMWFDFINEHDDFAKMIAISACIQERQDKGGLISESFQFGSNIQKKVPNHSPERLLFRWISVKGFTDAKNNFKINYLDLFKKFLILLLKIFNGIL